MSNVVSKKKFIPEAALNRSLAKISSIENLTKGQGIIDSHAQIDIDSVNNQSFRNHESRKHIKSNASINDQIRAFLKNDPSATHLGDIGSIFGGGSDNQIAQSVKRLGSISKINNGGDAVSTVASTLAKNKSKLNMVVNHYLVQKPSSINLDPSNSIASLRKFDSRATLDKLIEAPTSNKKKLIHGTTVRRRNQTIDPYEHFNI